jgi:hypothetical protein
MKLFQVSPLTPSFAYEVRHENYVSQIISIHHKYFGITFIQTFNQSKKKSSKKIIYFQLSSKSSLRYFIIFVIFIHVYVVFIQHNCFGINFIHSFHPIESFIQTICVLAFIIQKFH